MGWMPIKSWTREIIWIAIRLITGQKNNAIGYMIDDKAMDIPTHKKRKTCHDGKEKQPIMRAKPRMCISTDVMLSDAFINSRYTKLFQYLHKRHTVQTSRVIVRDLHETKWYRMNKCELISVIAMDTFIRRIQRFYKTRGKSVRDRCELFGGLRGITCPITLIEIEDIPIRDRFLHANQWYDRKSLSDFLRISCDFVSPVTRVEFTLVDVLNIDESLLELYNKRESIRKGIVDRLELIQGVENELEDIFKEMIEMACVTPTRGEFNVIMTYSEIQFEQSYKDLMKLDKDRCIMALTSLPDLLEDNSFNRYSYIDISRKRKKELKELVREFIYKANNTR